MHQFISFFKQQLSQHLPGRQAQIQMAPKPVSEGELRKMDPPEDAQRSSVLVLLFPNEEENLELVLTLRSHDIDHGGQISFPGGRREGGESLEQTALREAKEEIGVLPEAVTIVGELSDLYVSHSDNLVTPFVGFVERRPDFSLNPAEVEEVFSIELQSLVQKKNITVEDWDLQSYTYKVPYWNVHEVPLWGATAMMLNEFLDIYRQFLNQQTDDSIADD